MKKTIIDNVIVYKESDDDYSCHIEVKPFNDGEKKIPGYANLSKNEVFELATTLLSLYKEMQE